MMSNIYNKVKMLGITALTAMALTACDDYMKTESKSALSTDNAYSTPAAIDKNLTGVYGALKPFA